MSELFSWDLDDTIRPGNLTGDAIVYACESDMMDPVKVENFADPTMDDIRYFIDSLANQSQRNFSGFLDHVSDAAQTSSFTWAQERLKEHSDDTHVILSHSPDFLVRSFARGLGNIRWAHGSWFHTKDLVFSGRTADMSKHLALNRYKRKLGVEVVAFAASDHIKDQRMLSMARHAVVVNPADDLRAMAVERGWEIVTETAQRGVR